MIAPPGSPGGQNPAYRPTHSLTPLENTVQVLMTLLLGLVANLLGTGSIWELNVLGFVVAVIAAVLFIGVAEGATHRDH